MFTIYSPDRGLISNTYKELKNLDHLKLMAQSRIRQIFLRKTTSEWQMCKKLFNISPEPAPCCLDPKMET